jgi:hypothetical protein
MANDKCISQLGHANDQMDYGFDCCRCQSPKVLSEHNLRGQNSKFAFAFPIAQETWNGAARHQFFLFWPF